MPKKVVFLSDFPFSIATGGKEVQLLNYKKFLNNNYNEYITVKLLDYFNEDETYDIIHLFGYSNWYYDLVKTLKANFPNIKIVISPNFYYKDHIKMKLTSTLSKFIPIPNFFSYKKFFLKNSDKIVVNSFSEKKQLISLFNIEEEKICVIPNFVESNFEVFKDDSNVLLFKKTYNVDNYLLCVGHLDERKNTINLVRAFLEVYKEIKIKLLIIGDYRFRDRSKREFLENLIKKNKEKIIHIPSIPRDDLLKSAYYNCKAHVLPSFLETPGLSNLEAALFKKNILVGDCEPVREYFLNYAVYCNPKCISSIKRGILQVIREENRALLLYKHIKSNYTEKQVIPKLFRLYTELF